MNATVTTALQWVVIRCKWCNRPQSSIQGGSGAVVRFKCRDRGCGIEQEFVVQ